MTRSRIVAIDLFCGAGGLTHGLAKEGIIVNAGFDIDPNCEFPYEKNNRPAKFYRSDIRELDYSQLRQLLPNNQHTLLAGCAPCQPFSTYTQGREKKCGKWSLLGEFARLVTELEPTLVSMENVPQLIKYNVFTEFMETLDKLGYSVWHSIVECKDYGVPQTRKRLVLLASRIGSIELIKPTHRSKHITVRQAIGKYPPLKAGEVDATDPLHRSCRLSDKNMRRIKASIPGGTWKTWPKDLVADCHKRRGGSEYISVYGRMSWNSPAPTMTTLCFGFGNGRFGHPEQNRAISLREAATLQTFPRHYAFTGPREEVTFANVGRLIGNAVPVRLARIIGRTFVRHVNAHAA